ncbi:hypothetical protein C9374_012973 [Naegleria lovaniensis]|uniref:Phytanoyl-CoA dioxygenase n=1 Tax=Naegleria lovaniensis TaxID=51637 RepID=A0AA88GDR1_NAELO|nr:uncharacterized protein C9374_012973 [Naegleria lovaniensis]KAG2372943.1 hypothetical protein C9374_012973 [Naegleria lovaniensis]
MISTNNSSGGDNKKSKSSSSKRSKPPYFPNKDKQYRSPPINQNSSSDRIIQNVDLSDEDLKKFLLDGYLVIKPQELALSPQWHSELCQYGTEIFQEDGNCGNNILARIPQLNEIFEDDRVKSILTRILGTGYIMQSHRFWHYTQEGQLDQAWHKDSFFGNIKPLRHHQLRHVMLMYYPQKTTIPMGPTALRKGTQYTCIDPKRYSGNLANEFYQKPWRKDSDVFMECEAGSLLLIHYDLIHRGSANEARDRQMFKFQFSRVVDPQRDISLLNSGRVIPSFENVKIEGRENMEQEPQYPVAKSIWNWMHNIPFKAEESKVTIAETELEDVHELNRIAFCYRLGLCGQYGTLLKRLDHINEQFAYNAAHGMIACRHPNAVKALTSKLINKSSSNGGSQHSNYVSLFIISEWGPLVVESLDDKSLKEFVQYLNKARFSSMFSRIYAAEALGNVFCGYHSNNRDDEILQLAVETLCRYLENDDEAQVRFWSALSLAKIGPVAASPMVITCLQKALKFDNNRYVIGFCLEALEKLGSPEALRILIGQLKASRWCYLTHKNSLF